MSFDNPQYSDDDPRANKHLVLDVGVTSCLTNSGLQQGADNPWTAARAYERRKILAVHAHPVTIRGSWRYAPFILEDYGRPGVHALACLEETQKLYPTSQLSPGIRCEGCSVQGAALSLTSGKCVHVRDKVVELLAMLC